MRTAATPRLVELLHERADTTPERVGYEFLHPDGSVEVLMYRELLARASHVAGRLQPAGREPALALLLFPPGLDYVSALCACLVAGVPAVPAYPPEPWRLDAGIARLRRILEDARPTAVLTSAELSPVLPMLGIEVPAQVVTVDDWSGVDGQPGTLADRRQRPDVALVQYTSGSTTAPRGVLVRHSSLEHNIRAIAAAFGLSEASRGFIWLPPYHDMGLIGGILTPLYVGFPVRLMSPLQFLKRPTLWLRQISDTRTTASGGPNFAYELCLRRPLDEEELAQLDLSSWELAFNGSEPVRWRTMDAFQAGFERAGFRASAFFPCYGLAEATLLVSGTHWDRTVVCGTSRIAVDRLHERADAPARVSVGRPLADQDLVVADLATATVLPEGTEGEICLRGPSVTSGYLGGTGGDVFVEINGARYLRTGDLGYLLGGQLVVTGRLSDVIVHRGVNYHAGDIEEAATAGVTELRPVAAAFEIEAEPEPVIALVVEARPSAGEHDQVAGSVRERVLAKAGVRLNVVVVVPPGTIPRTTSGKVQRRLTRDRLLAGEYEAHLAFSDQAGARIGAAPVDGETAAIFEALVELTCGVFAAVCGAEHCDPEQTLFEIGGDSLRAAEIAAVLESALDLSVPVELVLLSLTPAALVGQLLERWRADGIREHLVVERMRDLRTAALPSTTS